MTGTLGTHTHGSNCDIGKIQKGAGQKTKECVNRTPDQLQQEAITGNASQKAEHLEITCASSEPTLDEQERRGTRKSTHRNMWKLKTEQVNGHDQPNPDQDSGISTETASESPANQATAGEMM